MRCGPEMVFKDRGKISVLFVDEKNLATRHPFAASALVGVAEVSVWENQRARNRPLEAYESEDLSPSPSLARYAGMRTAMVKLFYSFKEWSL